MNKGEMTMEPHIESAGSSATASSSPVDLVGLGKKRLEAIFEAQSKLVDTFPALSREWMSFAEAERDLSADLLAKLTAARSIPESAKAYQEWLGRRMDMLADEARTMLDDAQKLVNVGARLFTIDMTGRAPPSSPPTTAPGTH
jgi:hypothetical protein